MDLPPQPFLDLGWIENFRRTSATQYQTLRTGPDSKLTTQFRAEFDAGVEFDLPNWGKLQMALSGGGQQINVLATSIASAPQSSGGIPVPAVYVQDGGSVIELPLAADALESFQIGDVVAVDWDYTGQSGYIGSGPAGAFLASALDAASHLDVVRRVTFNVSRVSNKSATSLILGQKLIGGMQTGMGVQKVSALLDREGGSYFQEWAALFVVVGGPAEGPATTTRGCRRRRARARRRRMWRARCSPTCCMQSCARCRVPIPMTGRRCCATEVIFPRGMQRCRRVGGLLVSDWQLAIS